MSDSRDNNFLPAEVAHVDETVDSGFLVSTNRPQVKKNALRVTTFVLPEILIRLFKNSTGVVEEKLIYEKAEIISDMVIASTGQDVCGIVFAYSEAVSPNQLRQKRVCFFKHLPTKLRVIDNTAQHKGEHSWRREWVVIGAGMCENAILLKSVKRLHLCPCVIVKYKDPTSFTGYVGAFVCVLSSRKEVEIFVNCMDYNGVSGDIVLKTYLYCKRVAMSHGYPELGPYIRRDYIEDHETAFLLSTIAKKRVALTLSSGNFDDSLEVKSKSVNSNRKNPVAVRHFSKRARDEPDEEGRLRTTKSGRISNLPCRFQN